MAPFIQLFLSSAKLRVAKHHVCAVSRRYPFDVQVPPIATEFVEFGDNSGLRGLDTESLDDGLLPGRVGSRLEGETRPGSARLGS